MKDHGFHTQLVTFTVHGLGAKEPQFRYRARLRVNPDPGLLSTDFPWLPRCSPRNCNTSSTLLWENRRAITITPESEISPPPPSPSIPHGVLDAVSSTHHPFTHHSNPPWCRRCRSGAQNPAQASADSSWSPSRQGCACCWREAGASGQATSTTRWSAAC